MRRQQNSFMHDLLRLLVAWKIFEVIISIIILSFFVVRYPQIWSFMGTMLRRLH